MNTRTCLITIGLACLGLAVVPSGTLADDLAKPDKQPDAAPAQPLVADTKTRDVAPGDYPDGYLAQRLGAMQKCTRLPGARVLDRDDLPLGKVTDLLVD